MTKGQWKNLRPCTRVTTTLPDLNGGSEIFKGVVVKRNSNWSQVLVKWDKGVEMWHGRLEIEIENINQ